MEAYTQAKKRIFDNQTSDDYAVLNYDCLLTREMASGLKSQVVFFSIKAKPENGVYVADDGNIVSRIGGNTNVICHRSEVLLPGRHNLENCLAAAAMAMIAKIPPQSIRKTLQTFEGVEHRLEFVREYNGIRFINDSKGTNPDSSIKAVEAMTDPTVLIAGGYDKGSDFTALIESFGDRIIHMIVIGQTADKLIEAANKCGFNAVTYQKNLKSAVEKAAQIAPRGGNVLLSPACASFDMFKDYEERGRVFKSIVNSLEG